MLARRTLLTTAAATLALLPGGHGLAGAPAVRRTSLDRVAGVGAGALVARAPGPLRGRHAAAARLAERPHGDLRAAGKPGASGYLRAEGLVAFVVDDAPGSVRYDASVAAVRERVGDARLGLIWWRTAQAAGSVLNEAVDALVLIDRIDAADGRAVSGRGVLCHFARRRSAAERRAIDLRLSALERAGSPLSYHWYDAAPGFAAPARQLAAAADLVWQRTAWFLARALAQPEGGALPGAAYGAWG